MKTRNGGCVRTRANSFIPVSKQAGDLSVVLVIKAICTDVHEHGHG